MKTKNKLTRITATVILFSIISLIYISCKKDSPESYQEPEYIQNEAVQSNVSVINPETATLVSDSAQQAQGVYILEFKSLPTNFKSGDIIVGQTGEGYLRKVTSSTIDGKTVTLQTTQATLTDLFVNVDVAMNFSLSNSKSLKTGTQAQLIDQKTNYLADGMKLASDGFSYTFSNTPIYNNGGLSLNIASGSLSFNPDVVFNFTVNPQEISKIAYYFNNANLALDCNVNLNATQKASVTDFEKTIAKTEKYYVKIIDSIPVFVVLRMELKAKFTANVESAFSLNTGFTSNNTLSLGTVYQNGDWTGLYNLSPSFTVKQPEKSALVNASQKLTIIPEISLKFYGVLGSRFSPQLYENYDLKVAPSSADWDASLNAGMNSTMMANIEILLYSNNPYSKSYININYSWKAPYKIAKVSGDNQTGTANQPLPQPIKVLVTDSLNNAIKDAMVYFTVAQGGGSTNPASIKTDANGFAQTTWTIGTGETQELKAQVKKADGSDISGSPLTFSTYVKQASIDKVSGDNQTAELGKALPNPLKVIVKDGSGNPLEGTKVNFTANNGGSVSQTQVTTGADGTASVSWTLGSSGATQTASVTAFKSDNTTPLQGSPMTFTATGTSPDPTGTVTDIDGNVYNTVTIGTQVWMAENLKVTHYRNGEPIPNVTDNTAWAALSTGAYCWYNNDITNKTSYGALYNWYTVADSRNIAPTGWHVPTDAEWTPLITYLGGATVAGGKMKESGTTHWTSPNTSATNESGFTALPGGVRGCYYGGYDYVGIFGGFWSISARDASHAWYLLLANYVLS